MNEIRFHMNWKILGKKGLKRKGVFRQKLELGGIELQKYLWLSANTTKPQIYGVLDVFSTSSWNLLLEIPRAIAKISKRSDFCSKVTHVIHFHRSRIKKAKKPISFRIKTKWMSFSEVLDHCKRKTTYPLFRENSVFHI